MKDYGPPRTIWVTKHWDTKGVYTVKARLASEAGAYMDCETYDYYHKPGEDYALTAAAAKMDVRDKCEGKVAKLREQMRLLYARQDLAVEAIDAHEHEAAKEFEVTILKPAPVNTVNIEVTFESLPPPPPPPETTTPRRASYQIQLEDER